MKTMAVVASLILVMSAGSLAYAVDQDGSKAPPQYHHSRSPQALLAQLPEEKEMLFHRVMREARDKSTGLRDQIAPLRRQLRAVMTAPEFNEATYRDTMKKIQALHVEQRRLREEAIITLAKQYTPEERKILAQLVAGARVRPRR